jgi:DNA-binding NtrC family response regulator
VGQANGHATITVLVTGASSSLRALLEREISVFGAVVTSERPEAVIVLEDENPQECLESVTRLRQRFPTAPLLVVTTRGSEQLAVAAFRAGAADYLNWPVPRPELERAWSRLVRRPSRTPAPFFLGRSDAVARARDLVHRFAATDTSVLITGETGTGKELAAKWLHRLSARAAARFVSVSCAASPDSLFEHELLGDDRSAAPGVDVTLPSPLLAADGGIVFLDQVSELSPSAQATLLRVMEHREVGPLGARSVPPVDVRWISASSSNLGALVREGRFRADLYHRLNAAEISLPPLREHPEDIGELAEAFLTACAARLDERPRYLSPAALEALLAHDWPGNVRELRNVIESSVVRAESSEVLVHDLPLALQPAGASRAAQATLERRRVLDALHATAGNKTEAARRLNWSRMTLYRKLMRYRIPVSGPRTRLTYLSPRA